MKKQIFGVFLGALTLVGCVSLPISGNLPNGQTLEVKFYTGGQKLDDLLIIDETNYFGKAQYQMDDPVGDVGFRFNDGKRVQAECTSVGKDIIGKDECKIYTVYRSNFDLIPEGTVFPRPSLY